ncbi:tRNA lysidine(34) synthetase TilS [Diplocloster agilis]|uniref:tRNA lysidine(34) synthetase TilS n=1 Tax=Diplocloster agilis TaxID=2850323 RepID=UPI000820829C|nr:tRNA lysidine(34) synthetase TilS [Suonthocola fibrivorans]MCU6736780.1 tRNA lysidine(34) synthetase TilS [Suonthocola fibrivorans]SCJ93558.1 tRNA(Ile)-lysidine synthase [uncultured Clostridium sp.]
MIQKILKFITENDMLKANDRVIVGVSGGADSVCLLFTLMEIRREIPLTLAAVHVEHGIRGEDAKEDARYVQRLCQEYDIPFRKYCYRVAEIARERKQSVEEAGRELRYQAFEEACREYHANKIAVAHHMDDDAETVLLNLFRGSGLKGLAGIPAVRGKIIRPLLCVTRQEIERYLWDRGITYRTDATNLTEEYVRNKVRLNILPYAEREINTKAVEHIVKAAGQIKEAEDFLESYAGERFKTCARIQEPKGQGPLTVSLDVSAMSAEKPVIRRLLLRRGTELLAGQMKDITARHIEMLDQLTLAGVGKEAHLPYGIIGRRGYDHIHLFRSMSCSVSGPEDAGPEDAGAAHSDRKDISRNRDRISAEFDYRVPGGVKVEPEEGGILELPGYRFLFKVRKCENSKAFPEKNYTKWFDYDKIKNGVRIRTRQTGDYMVVNSGGDHQKLKSYFIDRKIPRESRDNIPLLADADHIIWIIGYRISEWYKITKDTKRILEVQVEKEN